MILFNIGLIDIDLRVNEHIKQASTNLDDERKCLNRLEDRLKKLEQRTTATKQSGNTKTGVAPGSGKTNTEIYQNELPPFEKQQLPDNYCFPESNSKNKNTLILPGLITDDKKGCTYLVSGAFKVEDMFFRRVLKKAERALKWKSFSSINATLPESGFKFSPDNKDEAFFYLCRFFNDNNVLRYGLFSREESQCTTYQQDPYVSGYLNPVYSKKDFDVLIFSYHPVSP